MNNIVQNLIINIQITHTTTWHFEFPFVILTITADIDERNNEQRVARFLRYLEQHYTELVDADIIARDPITTDRRTRNRHRLRLVVRYIINDGHSSDSESDTGNTSDDHPAAAA